MRARRTGSPKLLAPELRAPFVRRERLERRLDESLQHRLTLVAASAGFGKSTLLAAWASSVRSCWYTITAEDAALATLSRGIVDALRLRVPGLPREVDAGIRGWRGPDGGGDEGARAQAFAAVLCDALRQRLRRDLVLVLDDLQEIDGVSASTRLVEALCRHAPPSLHLIVASRTDVPFAVERLRGAGDILELGGAELALSPEEARLLVTSALGDESAALAQAIHETTSGWPAATRLAVEALRDVPADERDVVLEKLRRPGGAVYSYLAAEVFQRDPLATALVRTVAPLEAFTSELCESLGVENAAEVMSSLVRRGLFLEPHRTDAGWFSLSGLVREFAATHLALDEDERRRLQLRAAGWYETQGHSEAALRSVVAAGAADAIAGVLLRQGATLLTTGAAEEVIAAIGLLPASEREAAIDQLLGEAQQMGGDWDAALASFERAAAGATLRPAGIAWRIGLIHHFQGRLDDAFAAYASARLDGSDPAAEALLLSWTASAHWLRGDLEACRAESHAAFETATACGDERALAAAHTALALLAALEGDRAQNDTHYLRALDYAERCGDVLQTIRIRANRGSRHGEEGDYEEALAELDIAISLADLAGFASLRALAFTNRGDVKFRIGNLDESVADLDAAKALYQLAGSRMVSYPLAKLGEVYRERGDLALARAACEEAVRRAEESQDVQGLVPALAGLARLLADEDPDAAYDLARRAVDVGPGMWHVQALLALGWVAIEQGDRRAAADAADEASVAARGRRDAPGLAEALELAAAACDDHAAATAYLDEALTIWRSAGNTLGVAWAELGLAQVSEGSAARERGESAARRFRELGARRGAVAAERLLAELDVRTRRLEIRTLGAFGVVRAGEPVRLSEWQSKKARDLLKILVARRGRPVTREALMELLWPEQDPEKLANRLSVALATLRSVLSADDRLETQDAVVADKGAVHLDLANVDVDVERFLASVDAALALRRSGASADATYRLELAEASFTGEFLEEDPYEDWVIPVREETRDAYVRVARALAEDAAERGDHDAATRYGLRILERDEYDERAHLGLVRTLAAAGRHGDARRRYGIYATKMEDIGVEPAPFPADRP